MVPLLPNWLVWGVEVCCHYGSRFAHHVVGSAQDDAVQPAEMCCGSRGRTPVSDVKPSGQGGFGSGQAWRGLTAMMAQYYSQVGMLSQCLCLYTEGAL